MTEDRPEPSLVHGLPTVDTKAGLLLANYSRDELVTVVHGGRSYQGENSSFKLQVPVFLDRYKQTTQCQNAAPGSSSQALAVVVLRN